MIAAVSAEGVRPAAITLEEVYRDHADALFRYCVSQVGSTAIGEEICGDVFASAYAAYARTAPDPDGVRRWLFRIARNAVIDHVRRERRQRLLLGRLGRERAAATSVEEQAEQRSSLVRVTSAMRDLSARDRQLVGLRVAGGLAFADLGGVLGMREQAAKVATHRALERLRRAMGEES